MSTHLSSEHAKNLTALIAHNALRLLVIQHWHSEASRIILLRLKVHLTEMGKVLMAIQRVRNDIISRQLLILGNKSPSLTTQVPVHHRVRDNILQTLEATSNQRAMSPGTGIADVDVVPALLGRVLGTSLAGDVVAERADLALELARGVVGVDKVRNLSSGSLPPLTFGTQNNNHVAANCNSDKKHTILA